MRWARWLGVVLPLTCACTSTDDPRPDPLPPGECVAKLVPGDSQGHPDPFGAKAAGAARAGRIDDVSFVAQPAHGRQQIENGDFALVNDRIAVIIEDKGLSDGYGRFGGEILAIDRVGGDGMPLGLSRYAETLQGLGLQLPNPTSVTVLKDGSDGEAIVRVIGPLEVIPFVAGSLAKLFKSDYDFEVAYDFILRPGWEKVVIRYSVRNANEQELDFGVELASTELFGFFQGSHSESVVADLGFAEAEGSDPPVDWVGFVGGPWSFAWQTIDEPMTFGLYQSGFSLYHGPGFLAEPCAITTTDRVEVIAGGPYYDGLREAIRRERGEPAWREVTGTVQDSNGFPLADALVHLTIDGSYASRVATDEQGHFLIHTPDEGRLVATKRGYGHVDVDFDADDSDVALSFGPHAALHIRAIEYGSGRNVPVRVQVIPTEAPWTAPASYGVKSEVNGRLHQDFAITGDTTLIVPAGEHRVIVSRGYEWELYDKLVTVEAGNTADVTAILEHSVRTKGVMCADFHIHSFMSADSNDPVVHKVKGAIADGLDIPVSSEHEWVVDFGPVVEQLGMTDWAFGMGSSELTTFAYGHFGVVPMEPEPGAYNNGAIDWIDRTPAETFAAVDAKANKPALIVNHPRGSIGGYLTATLFDRETATGQKTEWWSENFDALEVFNDDDFNIGDENVLDWFAFLDNGKRKSAVGSSDSHHLRTKPVGYPRTCMYFGHDTPAALSPLDVRDGVLSGNSTISGGLFMTVRGPNGEHPGATVAGGGTFTVTVDSPSWIDTSYIEAIVGGQVVETISPPTPIGEGTSNLYESVFEIDAPSGPSWVIFHARGDGDLAPLHPGDNAFAVSNPYYLE